MEDAGVHVRIFTRLQNPTCETEEEAFAALKLCGISKEALIMHNHVNCSYHQ